MTSYACPDKVQSGIKRPSTDVSGFYTVIGKSHPAPYIIFGTVHGSASKAAGYKSEIVIHVSNADVSQSQCCPKDHEYSGYVNDDDWKEFAAKPIANEYRLYKVDSTSVYNKTLLSRLKFLLASVRRSVPVIHQITNCKPIFIDG
ncbi:unnamed protein product [Strongylus vulgaris]|uniref:Uncharacterized protein n=1 Tax=Strongylus vulgaris TaxID=40348 RepID=A0A3P7KNQ6_STRVU|nr:unnamed protein product [Strongylus vulgaris]